MAAWAAIILAAGKGKRMRSRRPKVLHEVCGRPLAAYVARAATEAGVGRTALVVGYGAEQVRAAMGEGYAYVAQQEQLGTGHAVLQARPALESRADHVLVLNGDRPFVRHETLKRLMQAHETAHAAVTVLTYRTPDTERLGRIVRTASGGVRAVIEEAEATEEQRRIQEVNAGVYCFEAAWLWQNLPKLRPGKVGEVYLTDVIELAHQGERGIETAETKDPMETLVVKDRVRLAEAEAQMRQRIRERWMLEGVTIVDPASTYIDADAQIGQDTVVHPNTTIAGASRIGEECAIGPGSIVAWSTIGDRCRVLASVVEDSTMEEDVDIGPYSHLRGGAYVEKGCHLGNFVEIKKSRLGQRTKSGHFSYIGDATLGREVNVGAGSITCNFDGVNKLPTVIEDGVFIGCDTMLVAPVKMGARSKSGAGAVVTKDVPPGVLVVGVPARPLVKAPAKAATPAAKGRRRKG